MSNNKISLKDMAVILLGIIGSVLQENVKHIQETSLEVISSIVLSRGRILQDLKLEGTYYSGLEYGDGIKATRLVSDAQIIPGLIKVLEGYSATSKLIIDKFVITNSKIPDKNNVVSEDIYNDPEEVAADFCHFPMSGVEIIKLMPKYLIL
ncbi:MAG: hypothetical protein AAGE84_31740 [Cyanobacteria bacterium P01_G01_bin.39]